MKIHLRARHFQQSTFLGASTGEVEAIRSHGDPIQRAVLEAYPGATKIVVSINWCRIDKAHYDLREYTDFQYQADKKAADIMDANEIVHTINLIQNL